MGIEGLLTGRVLLGRYRVDAAVGRGGMGVVYRAMDQRLSRAVAIKVLSDFGVQPGARERARSRFEREAVVAAQLHHPNVVRVYDFGTDPDLDLDVLVMEMLNGVDLQGWHEEFGIPPLPLALDLLTQAARGIGAGHRAGLVHRDIKPGNLFVSTAGDSYSVHVLDFGIVELTKALGTMTQLTMAGFTPHSAGYASPEQLRGGSAISPASDVFSLAATAFEFLTGERAFQGVDSTERRQAAETLSRRLAERGIPTAVVATLRRALAEDPAERWQDGDVFADALKAAASGCGAATLLHPDAPADPTTSLWIEASTDPVIPEAEARPEGSSLTGAGLTVLGVVLLLAIILALAPTG